jgi:hypothetical protein
MRITLLIDIETKDVGRLQIYVKEQPSVSLRFEDGWDYIGRFIGAKEAISLPEVDTRGESP